MKNMCKMILIITAITQSAYASFTCPQVEGMASCKSGKWQLKMTTVNSEWEIYKNKLQDAHCEKEGETLEHLKWKLAWNIIVPGSPVECYYSFTERKLSFMDYDISYQSSSYQADIKNRSWSYDYNWGWRCDTSLESCTVISAKTGSK